MSDDDYKETEPTPWTCHKGHDIWVYEDELGVYYSIDCGDFVLTPDWETAKRESIERINEID